MILRMYLGEVIEIENDSFWAALEDEFDPESDTMEIVQLPFSAVHDDDKPLIQLGATFWWNIGYNGDDEINDIRFRTLPRWRIVPPNEF